MSLQEDIVRMQEQLSVLMAMAKTQKESQEFTPSANNPFMRRPNRVSTIMSRPVIANSLYGVYRGFVVDTRDPYLMGRVKVFIPMIHADVSEEELPWVIKSEPFGSLEDQGSVNTPPAGSTVLVQFESGQRDCPIIMNCIHNVTRKKTNDGKEGGFLFLEERNRWGAAPGQRSDKKNPETNPDKNYLMPPWNNESYNGKDMGAGDKNSLGYAPTIPHIYGYKTPEKHFLQFVDGDYKRQLFGKRVVLQTSRGSFLWMKDDEIRKPKEIFEQKFWDDFKDAYPGLMYSAQPFNNHKVELKHTGLQLQSYGGGRLVISDETEKDGQSNDWRTPYIPRGKMRSFIAIQSISEHKILLCDYEKSKDTRGRQDGIFLITATGHFIGMRDDSQAGQAAQEREIIVRSTSGHHLKLNDYTCKLVSPKKGDQTIYYSDGKFKSDAKRAYAELKSGWGQLIRLDDFGSQEDNAQQFILIRNNYKGKGDCKQGPPWNFIRMNCVTGDKFFHIWGAGTFMIQVCHDAIRLIHKRNDLVIVEKGDKFTIVEKGVIFEHAEVGIIHWTTFNTIQLLVGRIINNELEFPAHPVVLAKEFWPCPLTFHVHNDTFSDHVFASE